MRRDFVYLVQTDTTVGFLSRSESEHDAFGAGHAGTAVSAALGMAAARDARKGTEKIVAVVGDGSDQLG
jgi:1-deoxy-D-xylulose-5-phosphate synthase